MADQNPSLEEAICVAQGMGHAHMGILTEVVLRLTAMQPNPALALRDMFDTISARMERTLSEEVGEEPLQFARQWTETFFSGLDMELGRRGKPSPP